MLWWASLLMFIGATGFNISNIAQVLVGDAPLDLSTSQEVTIFLAVHLAPPPALVQRSCRSIATHF